MFERLSGLDKGIVLELARRGVGIGASIDTIFFAAYSNEPAMYFSGLVALSTLIPDAIKNRRVVGELVETGRDIIGAGVSALAEGLLRIRGK